MSDTKPGADELRVRAILRARGIGLDAAPPKPVIPPKPAVRPRDWLDDILDSAPEPAPSGPEEPPGPVVQEPAANTPKKPGHQRPAFRKPTRPAPRQSLADAWDNVPPRLRWLGYHATAAGAGWCLGWVGWGTDTAAWYAAGHWASPSGFVLYGLGACALALYRRSRTWAWPFAWAAAIPVSSVVVGVLLYGTGYQP